MYKSKQKWLIEIIFLIALVIISTGVFVSHPTFASIYPQLFSRSNQNEPKLDPTSFSAEDLSTNEASEMVQNSLKQWEEKILKGGNWVHLLYQINSEIDNRVILPDGKSMPSSYLEEGWYFINENGLVEKNLVTLKDEFETIYQQSALSGSTEYNLTFEDKLDDVEPYKLKLDRGFTQYLMEIDALHIPVKYIDTTNNNKSIKEFSFEEIYETPIQENQIAKPIQSAVVVGLFDIETGQMMMYRKLLKCVTGEQMLFEEWHLLLAETLPDAPTSVLDVLENVK